MKANELRIGNWYDHNGEYRQVTPNTIEEVWEVQRTWCKPIPLTEEWLVKFGFEKSDNEFYTETFKGDNKSDYYFCIRLNDNLCDLVICERVDEINNYSLICPKYIKYVHQLQNLFYCLCGEELEIKC